MPQSFASIIIHLVFSTKDRQPFLDDEIAPRMHAYLATVCREAAGVVYQVGGVAAPVHPATSLPRTLTVADLAEKVKVTSSAWIKTIDPTRYRDFHWQRGYGAFSVGASAKDALVAYIQNQAEHHRIRTFQDEYRELLKRHGLTWDERYAWD